MKRKLPAVFALALCVLLIAAYAMGEAGMRIHGTASTDFIPSKGAPQSSQTDGDRPYWKGKISGSYEYLYQAFINGRSLGLRMYDGESKLAFRQFFDWGEAGSRLIFRVWGSYSDLHLRYDLAALDYLKAYDFTEIVLRCDDGDQILYVNDLVQALREPDLSEEAIEQEIQEPEEAALMPEEADLEPEDALVEDPDNNGSSQDQAQEAPETDEAEDDVTEENKPAAFV